MQVRLTTDTGFKKKSPSSGRVSRHDSAASARDKSPFEVILDDIIPPENQSDHEYHQLWSNLPSAEKNLIHLPTEENLSHYRELIRKIAGLTLKRNTRVKKLNRKSRNATVELNVVDILDDRLQQMVLMIQSRKNTAFQIMNSLDEIRGILIDLRDHQ